jgi:hypothetical protein
MPYGDRTGPLGLGPRLGARRSRCSWPKAGGGWGGGYGAGRSWSGFCRRIFAPEETASADRDSLIKDKLAELEQTLAALKGQLADLGKK